MTSYVVLLPADDAGWDAELAHSREARVVRRGSDGLTITDGPYAETVEQLSGFYLVESDDLDDLLDCAGILAGPDGGIEVRRMLGGAAD